MKDGLSALVRLRNEEVWASLALESFVDWCDELVVVLNCCTDRTPDIVDGLAFKYPEKIRVYEYPHEIWPMGPGHDRIPVTDPRSSAAFYNFTQRQATCTHVVKLDGDMVMMDWAGQHIRALMRQGHDRIKFEGRDIVGEELTHIGCHPRCPTNGVYLKRGTHYTQGQMTQNLRGAGEPTATIEKPAFLHFKWARKSFEAATVQWPEGWESMPHFQRIAERRHPVAPYRGEYPASVRSLIDD